MTLTQEQIEAEQARILKDMKRTTGRGRVQSHVDGRMNTLERAYAEHLLARMMTEGDVVWFEFEPMKFRLAKRCWYCPDFIVQRADGTIEAHECKGHLEDDAAVKLRVMARIYPMIRLLLVRRVHGEWKVTEYTA